MFALHRIHVSLFLFLASCTVATSHAEEPRRLARDESFFGIHFDFHAGPDCTEVGKNTTPEMIHHVIDLVQPDYVQIDCKGHAGYSSYPTQVGNQAPGFVGDPLRIWRDETARRGVALYMHYSGVWDSRAIALHPDWGVVNADGTVNDRAASFFGPYADRLLIPQLRELAGNYGVDGVWVDGECWAAQPDYGETALRVFRETTGIEEVPRKPSDPYWFEFLQFHRQAFRNYFSHYVTEVKQTHPQFQICGNWAFTDHMPEEVCVPVDFLSGDYSPQDSVNSARLSARFVASQGVPWDLMAWSFTTQPTRQQKPSAQLKREAAVVVALGGGFQAYFQQRRDGSVQLDQMPTMAEIAKFCRARESFCHRAKPIPQVAMLFSTAAHYRHINGLFSRDNSRLDGVLQSLLDNQLCVEVIAEHQLTRRMHQYPLIVIPEWKYLAPAFRDQLVQYVRQGGGLLLVGDKTMEIFRAELQAAVDVQAMVPATDSAVSVGLAASVGSLDKGQIGSLPFGLGHRYRAEQQPEVRDFVGQVVREMFSNPIVKVEGSHHVDVSVAEKNDLLLINLVNTSGPHQTESIMESISPIGPLQLSVRVAQQPNSIRLEPAGQMIDFEYTEGVASFTIAEVPIHEVVVIQSPSSSATEAH